MPLKYAENMEKLWSFQQDCMNMGLKLPSRLFFNPDLLQLLCPTEMLLSNAIPLDKGIPTLLYGNDHGMIF